MKRLFQGLALVGLVTAWAACGSSGVGLQPGINGCTTFSDATAPGASRTLNFGGGLGNSYDLKCLAIAAGQSVTWNGDFSVHPLRPGLAPSQAGGPDAGSPNNPIQNTDMDNSKAFAFAAIGIYPYYCSAHQNQGMFGTIQVR